MVSGPEFVYHESRFECGGTHNESEAIRESDDQGSLDCTPRQCHQDIRASQGESS